MTALHEDNQMAQIILIKHGRVSLSHRMREGKVSRPENVQSAMDSNVSNNPAVNVMMHSIVSISVWP